ncbi:MAG: S9 family peptidase [candidate division Zixibacteria bacterium]|nr:S9 family peptidase [candidate division Zixibacteria bacterium]
MNRNVYFIMPLVIAISTLISCSEGPPSGRPDYPVSKTVDVADTLHGVVVPDPYRWLEDTDDPDVQTWTDAQNLLTRSYLDKIPDREKILSRLEETWNYPTQTLPKKCKERYFILKNEGLQNHYVLYSKRNLDGVETAVIDPNAWSEDGTSAMDWWTPSDDGSFVAYGKSESGAERGILHIKNVLTGKDIADTIPHTRYPNVNWLKDNSGFFYTRFPAPGTVPDGDENYFDKTYFHKLGDDWANDKLYYSRADIKELGYGCQLSTDDRYLILYDFFGSSRTNEVRFIDLKTDGKPVEVVSGFHDYYEGIAIGNMLYIRTNEDAPNYKIIAVDLRKPAHKYWKEIVPETEDLLESYDIINNTLIVKYLHNAYTQVKTYNLLGVPLNEIELPALGTVYGFSGRWDDDEMYLSFSSFIYPTTHYRYDFETNKLTEFYRYPVKVNADGYETKQVWYNSKDGTRVSMFIVHKAGLALDGTNPAYLYGYGGFTANMTPYFSSSRFIWMENGGVFCLPNLRGGAEYGEQWHKDGMLENKQNTFDDFIAAAKWLIDNSYTSPEKLAISGGSNGGLLVGAVAVQRPDLFKAVLCNSPLLDMLRYHKFLMARYWVSEYGSSDDADQFKYIYAYSPYHNIKQDAAYPAMLFRAGESDSRVHPLHARKMTAALQTATSSDAPILIYVERKTGHGQGMPTNMRLQEVADDYAFLFWQLGMKMSGE